MMIRKVLLLLSLVIALGISPEAFARMGNEGANGGDDIGLEFQGAYFSALDDIRASHPDLLLKVEASRLFKEIDEMTVLVVNEPLRVTFDGITQDSVATNRPAERLILVNRFKWAEIHDETVRMGIALHEALSVFGLESTGKYPISSRFVSRRKARP